MEDIKKLLLGLKLKDVEMGNGDSLQLTFEGDLVLIISGGYCKEVFTEIKRRKIIFEDVKQ
ncbi:hypothetical protein [Dehalobacter sp. TeCB1]|uniref:hypothetical protein n=1 Tax=Dehalobacter sp. TeCB1 TaxID=1843715 RepID=UPI00083B9155|nr:hypothetical protein [Dehalobacter sp. TeCB1]OCZ54334.1 hypothetical protein A7D23_06090 [Dehalobacter sp. TeCB1]